MCCQLAESVADSEDLGRQTANLRRKLQRGNQDMADVRLHLEEQIGRNAELEKKQRKWVYCSYRLDIVTLSTTCLLQRRFVCINFKL